MLQHVADSSRPVISKVLEPGSLLVMSGATQEHWYVCGCPLFPCFGATFWGSRCVRPRDQLKPPCLLLRCLLPRRHQLPLPAEPTDNPGEAHRSAEAPPHRISLTFRTIVAGFEDAGQPMRQSTDPH